MGLLVSHPRLWLGQPCVWWDGLKAAALKAPCPKIMAKACIFMRQCT